MLSSVDNFKRKPETVIKNHLLKMHKLICSSTAQFVINGQFVFLMLDFRQDFIGVVKFFRGKKLLSI